MSADTQTADTQTLAPPGTLLRALLIFIAIVETLGALSGLGAFGNLAEYTGNGAAQWVLLGGRAILPLLAIPALIFAIRGDVRRAVIAIAAIVVVTFLTDYLPSMFIHGLELRGGVVTSLHVLAMSVVFPLLAVVAFVLARRNERLVLAAVLVSLSTLANVLGVIAFAVAVAIYGF